jgi:hypothetical protein
MRLIPVILLFCVTGAAWAQGGDRWEISARAGGSMYRDITVTGTNPPRAADSGFFKGVAAGAVVSQNGGRHWGGEFHYLFQTNNMRLRGADGTAGEADFAAQSHAFHYDALLYFTDRESRVRPFVAGGPGFKWYQGTGRERAFQPLNDIVAFSRDNQLKFMVSAGAGVKVYVGSGVVVRFDFRDYITGIPGNFVPAAGVRRTGQFHNFVGTGGIGVTF